MKKRIGTKLYDTSTSERVTDVGVGVLYRKKTRLDRGWFLVIEKNIEPIDDLQAKALLGEGVYEDKPSDNPRGMVNLDRDTHSKILAMAKRDGVSIAEEVRLMIERLNKQSN